ncbi:hypothetical protein SLS60_011327 [Paraconiothyrium brasiliense]|uniref:Uncharacterized protein n=1 Tax=Paraconiothyrium brasiliense TaxID=300254 RepID=A0ABR3QJB5_9PLEO
MIVPTLDVVPTAVPTEQHDPDIATVSTQGNSIPSVFYTAPTTLTGFLRVIQERVNHQTLAGPDVSLSYHGRRRADYILKQGKKIAKYIHLIEETLEVHAITRNTFTTAFNLNDREMAIIVLSICKLYDNIFETLSQNNEKFQFQRNLSAHGCGISGPYDNDFGTDFEGWKPFVPATFWDNAIDQWIPSIKDELSDLIVLLHRDLLAMEDTESRVPIDAGYDLDDSSADGQKLPFNLHLFCLKTEMKTCEVLLRCSDRLGRFFRESTVNVPNQIRRVISQPVSKAHSKFSNKYWEHRKKLLAKTTQAVQHAEIARQWEDEALKDDGATPDEYPW